ncbi:MAG TPA: SRPBCC family protein [Solirubrobacterales bacterium]|jgi:ribosome-associated toxin RatA of RatAB toxin-antitoxin module|nr:SRPBCC family protein [Solirubrobacterales bacterium]
MGTIRGNAATEINAVIDAVYAVAADAEGAPRWQPEIQVAECLERDADGNQILVRVETETPIKRLASTLRYSYDSPSRISWQQEDGDLKSVVGSWEFEQVGDLTKVTYELAVDPGRMLGMALRGPVVGVLRGKLVESMPDKLKTFVEAS